MSKWLFLVAGMLAQSANCGDTVANQPFKNSPPSGFALLELFTSEGCSSCPPADEEMIRLGKEFGDHLYVVGFHVDYWDKLGWKDAFSDPSYSQRQRGYASFFGLEGVYTPQVVINGNIQMVGSDDVRIRQGVQGAFQTPVVHALDCSVSHTPDGTVSISFRIKEATDRTLNLALVQLFAASRVESGENHGKLLHHRNIVRAFQTIDPKALEGNAKFQIPGGLTAADCHLIGWIQDRNSHRVLDAFEAPIQ
jgi:hypothetical protein